MIRRDIAGRALRVLVSFSDFIESTARSLGSPDFEYANSTVHLDRFHAGAASRSWRTMSAFGG